MSRWYVRVTDELNPDNVIQQLHTTLTQLSVSSADRYEAEAPIVMDLVKYLLRQKQQLAINKEKIGSAVTATQQQPAATEAPVINKVAEPTKVITNGKAPKPAEPVPQVTNPKSKEEDYDFLNNFEMPGKFAVPDKVVRNTSASAAIKPEKPKDPVPEIRAPVDNDATILYDSTEQASAANGAVATNNATIVPKKRKLDDSDDGKTTKK